MLCLVGRRGQLRSFSEMGRVHSEVSQSVEIDISKGLDL